MRHLDILLPFGLLPATLANDLLRALALPSLATLITGAKTTQHQYEDFAKALPHETWLTSQFALSKLTPDQDNSPALACATMQTLGLHVPHGTWFILHPAHIHIARDHLVLTDIRQIDLSAVDGRLLFEIAAPLVAELGKLLVYGNADTWFIRADDWQDLQTSTPDAACGHNIDIWMPQGSGAQAWRKIQNEVQMHWYAHPFNQEREQQGKPGINGLWLWGGATASATSQGESSVYNLPNGFIGLQQYAKTVDTNATVADIIRSQEKHNLLILDQLLQPALLNEWSTWLEHYHSLEKIYFTPLLHAIQTGALDSVTLILSDHTQLHQLRVSRFSLKKFWLKPSLNKLLT